MDSLVADGYILPSTPIKRNGLVEAIDLMIWAASVCADVSGKAPGTAPEGDPGASDYSAIAAIFFLYFSISSAEGGSGSVFQGEAGG